MLDQREEREDKMSAVERLARHTQALIQLIRISEHKSINRAAAAMHVSQSALTRSLARLEETAGASLFERTVKGVRLTTAGEIVLQHARVIERQIKGMRADLDAAVEPPQNCLRVGATPLVGSLFLHDAIAKLQAGYPKLAIRHAEGARPELLASLRREELDAVLSTFPFEDDEPGLLHTACFDLDLRVVVRASHPLSGSRPLHLRELSNCKWVLPHADTDLYRRVKRDFARAGANFPRSVIETSSPAAARHLMAASDALAILPMRSVASEVDAGLVSILSGDWTFERRTVGWFVRTDAKIPRELRFLMRSLTIPDAQQGRPDITSSRFA
jgi:DNA-binding transcriptional LysR family regulator